jgi:high affinity sulfate transporter 1
MPGTPTDSGGPTPVASRWDLTVRPPTPNRPLGRAATDPNFQAGSSETTRLLATKHPKYWDVTDSETEERGRGGKSTAGAPRSASTASTQRLQKATRVAKKIRQRSKYYVPVTEWLPTYSWSLFAGDVVAGISVACLMVPQAMSYATSLAKLTPVAGLWSSSVPVFLYGLLGTSRQLSMGPEASLSLMLGQLINDLVWGDPHNTPKHPELEAVAISVMATFQVGLITGILGLLRLGFLDVVLSRALLRGFITAIGVIISIEQSIPLLGLAHVLHEAGDPPTLPIPKLIFIIKHITRLNPYTAILSACCLTFLIVAKVVKQRVAKTPGGAWLRFVPEILLVVVFTTLLTSIFRWDLKGVDILGKVKTSTGMPFGLPLTSRPLKYFNQTFPTAFVMALVGVVDSMVAARENATKYSYPVSPNRELVAYGATNLVASTLTATGSLPIFGSLTRSRLNGNTGGRTQMASLITASLVLLSIFFLMPWLFFLPRCVLASIITTVVYGILNEAPHDVIYYWRMRAWPDGIQMAGTFLLTLLFSIEVGVVASVGFSLLLVIQHSTQPRIKIIGRRPDSDDWVPIDEDEEAQEEIPGVLVVRIREPLSFANTGGLKERLRRLELYGPKKSHPSDAPRRESAKAVILHMGDVDDIDASALQILSELVNSYQERGVGIYFAHLHPQQLEKFHVIGIPQMLGPSRFHPDVRSAMLEVESLGFGNRSAPSRFLSHRPSANNLA